MIIWGNTGRWTCWPFFEFSWVVALTAQLVAGRTTESPHIPAVQLLVPRFGQCLAVKRRVETHTSANVQSSSHFHISRYIFNLFLGSNWSVIVTALHITLPLDFRVAILNISDGPFAALRKPISVTKYPWESAGGDQSDRHSLLLSKSKSFSKHFKVRINVASIWIIT